MGQYYVIVNIEKKEFLHPHQFGDGLKLLEFGCNSCDILTGLTILLADENNNRYWWNLKSKDSIIGSWAGNKIVIAGNYADPDKFGIKTATKEDPNCNLYDKATKYYKDVSLAVIDVLKENFYIKNNLRKKISLKK